MILAMIAALALAIPAGLRAEHHDMPKPLTDVWVVVPKQGMEAQFEAGLKAHVGIRAAGDDSREWNIYTPVIGDQINMYQIRSCCHDYADHDAYTTDESQQQFSAHWGENVHPYVDHYHHYLEVNDWKNSHMPEGAGPFKYYGVTTWTWKENAGPGPEQARAEMSQIALKDGWAEAGHHWLWLSRVGGKPMLMLVSPFENYADMAPDDPNFNQFMIDKMGSEEAVAALFDKFSSGFAGSSYTVWTEREDMAPAEQE
jgi:hypothetical protein